MSTWPSWSSQSLSRDFGWGDWQGGQLWRLELLRLMTECVAYLVSAPSLSTLFTCSSPAFRRTAPRWAPSALSPVRTQMRPETQPQLHQLSDLATFVGALGIPWSHKILDLLETGITQENRLMSNDSVTFIPCKSAHHWKNCDYLNFRVSLLFGWPLPLSFSFFLLLSDA